MPNQIVLRFCARGYGRFQKLLHQCQKPSRSGITGERPESRLENVRHGTPEPEPHPHLARAPRDEITACDQVPHSDMTLRYLFILSQPTAPSEPASQSSQELQPKPLVSVKASLSVSISLRPDLSVSGHRVLCVSGRRGLSASKGLCSRV